MDLGVYEKVNRHSAYCVHNESFYIQPHTHWWDFIFDKNLINLISSQITGYLLSLNSYMFNIKVMELKSYMHITDIDLESLACTPYQVSMFPTCKPKIWSQESLGNPCVWLQIVYIIPVLSSKGPLPAGAGGCSAKGSCWNGSPMQNRKITCFIHYLARWLKFLKRLFTQKLIFKVSGEPLVTYCLWKGLLP